MKIYVWIVCFQSTSYRAFVKCSIEMDVGVGVAFVFQFVEIGIYSCIRQFLVLYICFSFNLSGNISNVIDRENFA